jgi:hypothetical protein
MLKLPVICWVIVLASSAFEKRPMHRFGLRF